MTVNRNVNKSVKVTSKKVFFFGRFVRVEKFSMLFFECFLLNLRLWLFFSILTTLLLPIDRCYTWIPTDLLQTKNPCYPYRTSINIANWMPKTMSSPKISPDKRCCVPNCIKNRKCSCCCVSDTPSYIELQQRQFINFFCVCRVG